MGKEGELLHLHPGSPVPLFLGGISGVHLWVAPSTHFSLPGLLPLCLMCGAPHMLRVSAPHRAYSIVPHPPWFSAQGLDGIRSQVAALGGSFRWGKGSDQMPQRGYHSASLLSASFLR